MLINKSVFFLIFLLWKFSGAVVFERNFQPGTSVNPGDTIKVTTTIRNDDTDTLKGLVYSEQIPSVAEVIFYSVSINNSVYNGIIYEQGKNGNVDENEIPYRWIFQLPPGFHENGYLAQGDSAVIKYGLTCRVDTLFHFNQDTWYGGFTGGTFLAPVFGYDSLNSVQLSFTNTDNVGRVGVGLISTNFSLFQNYPNPFNPITKIEFYLPRAGYVIIDLFDITGRKIKSLLDDFLYAGQNSIIFDGSSYSSGVYFYRMTAGNFTAIKKMILIE